MKHIAGRLRIDLAQYEEMARFVKFGAEVDDATHRQLTRGVRARALLGQPVNAPMPIEIELIVLFGAVNGLFDDVGVEDLGSVEAALVSWVEVHRPELVRTLAEAVDIDDQLEAAIRAAFTEFFAENPTVAVG
jgi:F-type H+-transporting ATPase subunit alpha